MNLWGHSFYTDSCMAVGVLVLFKWLINYDRVRVAEMVCMNLWGALVLHSWLYDFVGVLLYKDDCVTVLVYACYMDD
jgi:hypothetical protein